MMVTHGDLHEREKIQTMDDVRAFLKGTTAIEFSIESKVERNRWIRQTLVRFKYLSLCPWRIAAQSAVAVNMQIVTPVVNATRYPK